MPQVCPSCGTENPDEARFCFSCATPLAEPGARHERKFATALFADLVGSTSLAEREDPEVVQAIVGRAFPQLAEVIERYGGLVEKFVGDAILAVFGVPAVHEDDPERAVRAALELQAVLGELNRSLASESRPNLALRIGVEAGEVLVDLDRAAGPRDRMLTGDAVNTAARLQESGRPGAIVVGPTVYAATRQVVDYRELEPHELKGKAQLVPAWEVRRIRAGPPGERAPLGLEARLVGRDEELAVLKQTYHRVESEARPALVTVLGPAGVGKSRLALELSRYLGGLPERPHWLKGRCLAYGNVSYSALAEAVKTHCGIREDDAPAAVAQKATRAVEELFGNRDLAPEIEALVGSGEELRFTREELFEAWRRLVERLAARSPLALVLEDVHWADEGLLDFVDHLADWAQGRLLIVTLARPELLEARPGWGGGKRNYAALYLDPLTPAETEAMLADLLSTRLPEQLTRVVVERSEGNPLFGEEIVRMLIDQGMITATAGRTWEVVAPVEAIEVPQSIQGLIAARLDSLPAEQKALVQDASVVGRTFWLGAVERLSGRPAREALERLRLKEVFVEREPPTFSGELELAFRHVLHRDVAYESLPKAMRARKHVEVARWAEARAGGRRDEIAELLATHYLQALRYLDELGESDANVNGEALRWTRVAAERALRLWEQRQAVHWFKSALELAGRAGLASEELAALWESYARAGDEVEPYAEVARALESALALYEQLGDDVAAGRVEARLAALAYDTGDHDAVERWTERALARLEPLGESAGLALALHALGWHEFRTVRYREAEAHLDRAMAMAEHVGDPTLQGHAMVSLAFVFQQTGRGQESVALFRDALDHARQVGDLSLLLRAQLHICGALEEVTGEYEQGQELISEALELAGKAGNVSNIAWLEQMRSDLFVDTGDLELAERAVLEALDASRRVGTELVTGYALERMAYLHALRGQPDAAEADLSEAIPIIRENPEPWLQAWAPLIAGHIAQGRGDPEEAARVLAEGARPLLDRIFVWGGKNLLVECVRALVRVGRAGEAAPFRERLADLASFSRPASAFLAWADGVLEDDRRLLAGAAGQLEALGQRIDLARCLIDVGDDASLARARELLAATGATLFLAEIDQRATVRPSDR